MEVRSSRRAEEGFGTWWNLVHLTQGLVALSLLWNFVADAFNHLLSAVGGDAVLPAVGARIKGIDLCRCTWNEPGDFTCTAPLPPELCMIIFGCIVGGLLVYGIFKLVCWTDWVKEEITWEECWKEKKWYNPWDWITVLVCVTKKVVQWVLQKICKYVGTIVVIAVIVCVIAAVIVAL